MSLLLFNIMSPFFRFFPFCFETVEEFSVGPDSSTNPRFMFQNWFVHESLC
jgi:hypothetical protein